MINIYSISRNTHPYSMTEIGMKDNKTINTDSAMRRNLSIAAGTALANYLSDTFVYPFDTMNTWIKNSDRGTSMVDLVKNKIKVHGINSLVKGINTQFYGIFVPSFLYFFAYEVTNKLSRDLLVLTKKEQYSIWIPTITATISQMVALVIQVPMDTIKTRYQINNGNYKYNSTLHAARDTIQKEGFIRLFKASPLLFANMIIFNTILFQAYELFRINQMKREKKSNKELTLLDSMRHTAYASIIATFITNPLDLVLTRYQVIDSSNVELSMKKIVNDIYNKHGVRGLNRGVYFKTFYRSLDSLLYIPIYEQLRKHYGTDFATHLD